MLYPENPIEWTPNQPQRQFPEENRTFIRSYMDEFVNNASYMLNKFKELGFDDVICKDLTLCFYDVQLPKISGPESSQYLKNGRNRRYMEVNKNDEYKNCIDY